MAFGCGLKSPSWPAQPNSGCCEWLIQYLCLQLCGHRSKQPYRVACCLLRGKGMLLLPPNLVRMQHPAGLPAPAQIRIAPSGSQLSFEGLAGSGYRHRHTHTQDQTLYCCSVGASQGRGERSCQRRHHHTRSNKTGGGGDILRQPYSVSYCIRLLVSSV